MNKEDFVTYEQAVKLKELGFDWDCGMYYATQCYCEGNNPYYFDTISTGDLIASPKYKEDEDDGWVIDEEYSVLAPTIYLAQKWLRNVKGIDVHYSYGRKKWTYYWGGRWSQPMWEEEFDTPIEALYAGIDKVIEYLNNESKNKENRSNS